MTKTVSSFWVAYANEETDLSPLWADADKRTILRKRQPRAPMDETPVNLDALQIAADQDHVAGEDLTMEQWLRLSEGRRNAIVTSYANRKPTALYDMQERRT